MTSDQIQGLGTTGALIYCLVVIAVAVFMIVCMWKVFAKAGRPGWACIVPIYDIIVELQIAKMPIWMIILYLIPIANIYVAIMLPINIAKRFGKGIGFGLLLLFIPIVGWPLLAFGDAKYEG